MLHDVHAAVRALARRPGLTFTVILTLTLGTHRSISSRTAAASAPTISGRCTFLSSRATSAETTLRNPFNRWS